MSQQPDSKLLSWKFQNHHLELGAFPLIMGIVNVTPDSFSDGGQFFETADSHHSKMLNTKMLNTDKAVAHAMQLVEEGADILDLGGESTRPGAEPVSSEDEVNRVVPVIEKLAKQTDTLISIDTTKANVAKAALQAGASIVNDISGLTFDEKMPAVCQQADAGIICMHIQGTPQTMQDNPTYNNCVEEIQTWLKKRLNLLKQAGIDESRVVIDPGIGFGKTAQHNLEILSHIKELRSGNNTSSGRPVMIGHSRKRFLKSILNHPENERLFGTIGVSIACASQGCDILRVHDVAASKAALLAWQAVLKTASDS